MDFTTQLELVLTSVFSTDQWRPDKPFDFIHTRVTLGCFEDFKGTILQQMYDNLAPGGWAESQEFNCMAYCDDGTMNPAGPMMRWFKDMNKASVLAKRPLSTAHLLRRWYEQVGFVDVVEKVFKVPMNAWAKDEKYKLLGRYWEQNMLEGLSGFCVALFTKVLERTASEIEVSNAPYSLADGGRSYLSHSS
jgi:metalloendopeptidase OMA1, mitochondrial